MRRCFVLAALFELGACAPLEANPPRPTSATVKLALPDDLAREVSADLELPSGAGEQHRDLVITATTEREIGVEVLSSHHATYVRGAGDWNFPSMGMVGPNKPFKSGVSGAAGTKLTVVVFARHPPGERVAGFYRPQAPGSPLDTYSFDDHSLIHFTSDQRENADRGSTVRESRARVLRVRDRRAPRVSSRYR